MEMLQEANTPRRILGFQIKGADRGGVADEVRLQLTVATRVAGQSD